MNRDYLEELERGLDAQEVASANHQRSTPQSGVGLYVQDAMMQRLLESASLQLELTTLSLEPLLGGHPDESLTADVGHRTQRPRTISADVLEQLSRLEIIIADAPCAVRLRSLLEQRELKGEGVIPAIIAVAPHHDGAATQPTHDHAVDGVLQLPQLPGPLAAQLSILLYSHRAFARRYHNAIEELQLNRRIFRSVTSGISVANALVHDMPLTYVNPAFEAMTGYKLEEVQGRNCRFLQGTDRDQPGITLLREAISHGREVTVVLRNFRRDGSPFWNELSMSPIRNREGVVTHFVGIQTDVTARVEIEAALRESEKLAAVGRLASTIAHEINNPLESVMNLVYLAERAPDFAEARRYLATADRELQRVKLITTQSLRFFKQSTKPQAILCTELLSSVLDVYHSRLVNAQITVEQRERSTRTAICMESEIRQVLNNLVANAIDAMHFAEGGMGGRLLVRTREGTEPRSGTPSVVITIADTGTGIAPETREHIYKAFYTTKGISGTGLGLWISSEIVERHHGRLLVRSSTNPRHHGTVFTLYLPFQSFPA